MDKIGVIGVVGIVVIGIIIIIMGALSCYKKVRSNEVMIITGAFLGGGPKVVKGTGAFVIPGLQEYNVLDLSSFTLPIKVESNTVTQVPLVVEGTATLNLGSDETLINTSARKFLGVTIDERNNQLSEIVRGQIRGILGTMKPEDVSNKKSAFSELVIKDLQPLLTEMGVEVGSVQINDVYDSNGYIESLYAEDVANKRAEAEIAQANANRRSREAQAQQDQLAQEAEQLAARNIAEKQKETNIAKAMFKREEDAKKAEADQAYPLAQAEASKRVIETEGEARAIKASQDSEVAKREVAIAEQLLEAELIARAQAESKALKLTSEAEAAARRISAEAEADARIKAAKALASEIQEQGKAEAESIAAKGKAEAEAQELLAKALEKSGESVLRQQAIAILPEIAANLVKPYEKAGNITVFNGTQGVIDSSMQGIAQTFEFVKQSSGVDFADMMQKRAEGTVTIEGEPLVNIEAPIIKETE